MINRVKVVEECGYEYDFVEPPPDDLTCKICFLPARDPQQTNECCGQTFCHGCLNKYKSSTILDNNKCPYCNKESFTFFADTKTKRSIEDLRVFCPNYSLGCSWTGELRWLKNHLAKDIDNKRGCPFTELECSNCCGALIQRRQVETHLKSECQLRVVNCRYCGTADTYRFIINTHHKFCPKYPVECPNHCEMGRVKREEVDKHMEECPLVPVKCLFAHVGCDHVVKRRDIADHMVNAATPHMEYILNYILTINKQLDATGCTARSDFEVLTINNQATREQVEEAKQRLAGHDRRLDNLLLEAQALKQRAINAERKLSDYKTEFDNEKQKLAKQNEELKLEISRIQQSTSEEIQKACETAVVEVERKLKDSVDRITNEFAKTEEVKAVKLECEEKLQATEDKFKTELQKQDELLQQQLVAEIQAHKKNFDAFLRLQDWGLQLEYLHKTCSDVLPNVYVKITDFTLRPARNAKQDWSSQPFYASDKGYKMCLCVSPNSLNNNGYLSIRLSLMKGQYDNNLQWPMMGIVRIQLLNLLKDVNHREPLEIVFDGKGDCCKRVEFGDKSPCSTYYPGRFISHKDVSRENVERGQHFLKNDTMFFKILEFHPLAVV